MRKSGEIGTSLRKTQIFIFDILIERWRQRIRALSLVRSAGDPSSTKQNKPQTLIKTMSYNLWGCLSGYIR